MPASHSDLKTGLPSIAVIDSDAAVRDSFEALLGGVGYSVRTYESAREFLQATPDEPASCVLAATGLADLTAQALLRSIHDLGLSIPTILMANHARELPDLSAITAIPGFAGQLLKPVEESTLLATLEDVMVSLSDGTDGV